MPKNRFHHLAVQRQRNIAQVRQWYEEALEVAKAQKKDVSEDRIISKIQVVMGASKEKALEYLELAKETI